MWKVIGLCYKPRETRYDMQYILFVAKKVLGHLGDMEGSLFSVLGSSDVKELPKDKTSQKHIFSVYADFESVNQIKKR